jgi:hypothetical protein
MESEVRELLAEQVRGATVPRKQALRLIQKVINKSSSPALRERRKANPRDASARAAVGQGRPNDRYP